MMWWASFIWLRKRKNENGKDEMGAHLRLRNPPKPSWRQDKKGGLVLLPSGCVRKAESLPPASGADKNISCYAKFWRQYVYDSIVICNKTFGRSIKRSFRPKNGVKLLLNCLYRWEGSKPVGGKRVFTFFVRSSGRLKPSDIFSFYTAKPGG